MKLLTDAQLLAIQRVAMMGMQTDVTILTQSASLGLELSDDPYGSSVSHESEPQGTTVKGMLHSVAEHTMTIEAGQLVSVHNHRLWVPVGTEITNGDHVLINGREYVVNDTNQDETWPAYLGVMIKTLE